MRNLILPLSSLSFALIAIAGCIFSDNYVQWLECAAAGYAVVWILGGRRAHIVLLWICGIIWLEIAADVLYADTKAEDLSEIWFSQSRIDAILFSLAALVAIAAGMRCALWLGRRAFRNGRRLEHEAGDSMSFRFQALLPCYVGSWVLMGPLSIVGNSVTGLQQIVYTFGYLRYALLYLIASYIFERNRGFQWLIVIGGFEIAMGLVSYFSSFKEPVFIILLAFASSRRQIKAGALLVSIAAVVAVLWLSLVWSLIKSDFREGFYSRTFGQNVEWLTDRIFYEPIDYSLAMERLVARVGYTYFFSQIIARSEAGAVPQLGLYRAAVEHVLKPRLLFPNKASLDDSVITTALTGARISEGTSVGVGFVAEAYADFGFPQMLIPMFFIGLMLGWMLMYFLTRPIPAALGAAAGTATLFTQFALAENIDKALGGSLIAFIGMALILKFGYPLIGRALLARRPSTPAYLMARSGSLPT